MFLSKDFQKIFLIETIICNYELYILMYQNGDLNKKKDSNALH